MAINTPQHPLNDSQFSSQFSELQVLSPLVLRFGSARARGFWIKVLFSLNPIRMCLPQRVGGPAIQSIATALGKHFPALLSEFNTNCYNIKRIKVNKPAMI